jgi:hypothetical protein
LRAARQRKSDFRTGLLANAALPSSTSFALPFTHREHLYNGTRRQFSPRASLRIRLKKEELAVNVRMASRKQNGEGGGGKFRLLITLLFLGTMILLGVEIIPPYFAYYQFEDAIKTEAKFALTGYPKKSPDDIRDDVYKKAQELDIPASRDAIQLSLDLENGRVDIGLDYSVPIDLKVYQFTLQFHPHADNHTI